MRFFAVALLFCAAASFAQTPEVPSTLSFAGMTLTLRDDARRDIQKDVDGLMAYPRYYAMKVERAKTYFPLIEKIFSEEGIPDDFKYLVLQESALVPDAVSVSNAVGFWQFKDFTAMEMGLRVDKEVDERMNLISSTHGAARYLKKSNTGFNNWLLALQSYQMGAGGVKRAVGDGWNGARAMDITPDTYWYVRKYLAHKIAFEHALSGEASVKVLPYECNRTRTLKDVATEVSADESTLREYNKWLKGTSIPGDKTYTVLIPVGKLDSDFNNLVLASSKASKAQPIPFKAMTPTVRTINSVPVIAAITGDRVASISERSKINLSSFLKFNDISIDYQPEAGELFFLDKKKSKGEVETYRVKPGDDLWSVSQKFGVRIKNLRKYNRLDKDAVLTVGSLIWLQTVRPKTIVVDDASVIQLDDEAFDWDLKTPKAPESNGKDLTPYIDPVSVTPTEVLPISNPIGPVSATTSTYVVNAGDTYYSIARQFGLEVADLLTLNRLTIQQGLQPGQTLKVTDSELIKVASAVMPVTPMVTYEVKSSDTLYSIAREYGVTIKDIMDWNHKKDFSLTKGEKLEIRQSGQ